MARQEAQVADAFERQFGVPPAVRAAAPGRVNLLGEHTDYNGGVVLPMALRDLGVSVALGPGGTPGVIEMISETLKTHASRGIEDAADGAWSDYVLGCARAVAQDQVRSAGLRVALATSVPLGAGLSSSAALEVAMLRALTQAFEIPMTPVGIAQTAQAVENDFVGVPCGIMDQFASSVGTPGTALFLDTQTLAYSAAPELADHSFVVIESGVRHQLTDGGYATRVKECAAARAQLGVAHLGMLRREDLAQIDALPDPLCRRVRHVVLDNQYTRDGVSALRAGDAEGFGALMTQSHATARDNYEITVPETDALAAAAVAAGALGARQTGGGWGGAVVALVETGLVARLSNHVTTQFPKSRILAVT